MRLRLVLQLKLGVRLLLRARVGQHLVVEPRGVLLHIALRRGADRLVGALMAPDDDSAAAHLDLKVAVGVVRRDRIALSRLAVDLIALCTECIVPVPLVVQLREVFLIVGDIALRQHLRFDGPSLRDGAARRVHDVHIDDIGDHCDLLCCGILRSAVGRRRRDLDHAALIGGYNQRTAVFIFRDDGGVGIVGLIRPSDSRLFITHTLIGDCQDSLVVFVCPVLIPDRSPGGGADRNARLSRGSGGVAARGLLPGKNGISVVDIVFVSDKRRPEGRRKSFNFI